MTALSNYKHLFIAAFLLIATVKFSINAFRYLDNTDRVLLLEQEVMGLQNKRDELTAIVAYQQTDDFVEREARNKLNLIKPGELVYVYDSKASVPSETESSTVAPTVQPSKHLSLWDRILSVFR